MRLKQTCSLCAEDALCAACKAELKGVPVDELIDTYRRADAEPDDIRTINRATARATKRAMYERVKSLLTHPDVTLALAASPMVMSALVKAAVLYIVMSVALGHPSINCSYNSSRSYCTLTI
jgi:hypothetical protein